MRADLHIHTTASDGLLSPLEVVYAAASAGLRAIAITDHDTLNGYVEIKSYKGRLPCEVIPGVEINIEANGLDIHILGLGIDTENRILNSLLNTVAKDRETRAERMVRKLNRLGYDLQFERVLKLASASKSLGRPHVAAALVEKGYCKDSHAAFENLIGNNCPAYVPHYKLSADEAIAAIKGAGGIAVLAHPGLVGDDIAVADIIKKGLDGIEAYYPQHTPEDTRRYLTFAEHFGLVVTGGSDFHGNGRKGPQKLGSFSVSYELVEKMAVNNALK